MGDVTDFRNFLGAVIDRRAYNRLARLLDQVRTDPSLEVLVGGTADDQCRLLCAPHSPPR